MNRRGLSILSDLSWLLVFIISAVLCYAVLYRGIADKYVDTISSDESEALAGNAQYIAVSLLSQEGKAGTTEPAQGMLADSAIRLVNLYEHATSVSPGMMPGLDGSSATFVAGAELDAFPDAVAGSSYKATLESIFGPDAPFWKKMPTDGLRVESVIVELREPNGAKAIPNTQFDFTRNGLAQTQSCFAPNAEKPRLKTHCGDEDGAEHGIAYLPTATGSASLRVTMVWIK